MISPPTFYNTPSKPSFIIPSKTTSRQVKATAPATIWGQQVLAQRRDRPTNDFEAKAVLAYLRACGLVGATYSSAFNGLDVVHTFRV